MTRATGGAGWGATSTRSRVFPYAYSRASSVVLIPSCPPSSSINRTLGTRFASLMRVCGSGRRGGSNPPRLRGLKCPSPSSCRPPLEMKKPLARSGRGSRQPSSVEPPKRELGGERRFRPCLPGNKGSKFRPEFLEREGGLLPAVLPNREGVLRLLVPVDDDEGDLFDLGVSDPLADGVVGVVHLHAAAVEPAGEVVRRSPVALADGEDPDLDGCEPEGERAGVVLGQNADEALEGAHQRPMDHVRD